MRAIDRFVDLHIGAGFQIEAAELGEADAVGGGGQGIEGAKGIIVDLVLDAGVNNFHNYVTPFDFCYRTMLKVKQGGGKYYKNGKWYGYQYGASRLRGS